VGFVFVSAFYGIAEAGFRSLSFMQVSLLLTIFSASGVAAGLAGRERTNIPVSSSGQSYTAETIDELLPKTKTAYEI